LCKIFFFSLCREKYFFANKLILEKKKGEISKFLFLKNIKKPIFRNETRKKNHRAV